MVKNRDRLSKDRRPWNMSRIRGKNTKPEMIVRSLLHRMGYRFRLHVKNLPGRPDIVLPKYKVAIFVHDCFWHRSLGVTLTPDITGDSRIPFGEVLGFGFIPAPFRNEKRMR
jgi:DNA mismatch endonuclease Vsr